MNKNQYSIILSGLIALAYALSTGSVYAVDNTNASDQLERQLIDVLQSADTPPKEKAITCKRLAVHGTKDAVPALGALLSNKELSSWARIALEAISDPAADEVLREALGTLDGRLLVGVINSIGVRGDAGAVGGLSQRLKEDDAQVASVAAVALGRIGNDAAIKPLETALADAPAGVRSAVAEGCILCAERLLAEGKPAEAARLYDKVRTADVPKQRILEATRGAILARQSDSLPLLVQQLRSDDEDLFGIGLRAARELAGREVTEVLVAELSAVKPQRQAQLIMALADRDDDAALPAILNTAQNGASGARTAAVEVLGRVGNASCVPVLLDIAIGNDEDLVQAAKGALEGLPGTEVDNHISARLSRANGQMRRVLIELIGLRRIDAMPALLAAMDDSDSHIRSAALTALGSTVGPDDLSVLIARVASPKNSEELEAARQALREACVRMPDREACARQLETAMSQAALPAKTAFLDILASVGGSKALETVAAVAEQGHPQLQDSASRLLGKWMTADAAPVLLNLASSVPDEKYRLRALRGYIRIARQFTFPADQRADMCRSALKAAGRDAERKLVLQVLERYPSIDTLQLAVDAAKMPSLKDDATRVSLVIAQKIGGNSTDVQKLLAQVGHDPMKIEIIKASYGAGTKTKDVTDVLQRQVGALPLVTLPSSSFNASFGGDPAPGIPKQLTIHYRINGTKGEASFPENAVILLPMPEDRP